MAQDEGRLPLRPDDAPAFSPRPPRSVLTAGGGRGPNEYLLNERESAALRGELPPGGWRRALALWGYTGVPFHRAFRTPDAEMGETVMPEGSGGNDQVV